jgi:hypothetical protein
MDRLEEVLRLQKIRHPIERIIVDQNGAEQRLFGFDIVRRAPIGRSSRLGGELVNVRIKKGHELDYASDLVVIGILGLGSDKAPVADGLKARQRALCPIPTVRIGKSPRCGAIALDGYRGAAGRAACRLVRSESDQNEIDQCNQGCADARGDQGIVGTDVGVRIERWLAVFPGHSAGLGQAG